MNTHVCQSKTEIIIIIIVRQYKVTINYMTCTAVLLLFDIGLEVAGKVRLQKSEYTGLGCIVA